MGLDREQLRRPVGGARKIMNMFGLGKDDEEEQQQAPQRQPQPTPAPAGQPSTGGQSILPQAGQSAGQLPASAPAQVPGQEMLGAGGPEDASSERGRFAGEEIQGEGKGFLARLAPTLLGIGGSAIAGAVGGQGAAADFAANFMSTSKQLNDEKKAEGQQNLTRFESALRDGRLEEAYSLINTLPGDMMEGALRQLKDSDVKEMEAEEGGYMDDLTAATTVAQIEAVLEQSNTSPTMDGRGKATIQKASKPLIADLRERAEAAKKLKKLTIEEKEELLKVLRNQVKGLDQANELTKEQLAQEKQNTKRREMQIHSDAVEMYRDGKGDKFAREMGIDITELNNFESANYRLKLQEDGILEPEEIDRMVSQFENAKKSIRERDVLKGHEKSIQNTVRAFTDKIGVFKVRRPLTEADVEEEKRSIREQVAKVKREKILSDEEAKALERTSIAALQMAIDRYKEQNKVINIPKTDQQPPFYSRPHPLDDPSSSFSQILPTPRP